MNFAELLPTIHWRTIVQFSHAIYPALETKAFDQMKCCSLHSGTGGLVGASFNLYTRQERLMTIVEHPENARAIHRVTGKHGSTIDPSSLSDSWDFKCTLVR